jgi:ArsR family transcriptional regulator, arsenate/arsenite/antimonite-responsive transcriptional repressor
MDMLEQACRVGQALSDPNRLRALMALRRGELCVCQLIDLLGLVPSTVSKHMKTLKHAGLVKGRKSGKWMYYSLPATFAGISGAAGAIIDGLTADPTITEDAVRLSGITCRKD